MPKRFLHVVHLPVYWIVVGFAMTFVSPPLSIYMSVQIANSNRERADRAAAAAAALATETARIKACELFAAQLDDFKAEPPPSATGKRVQDTWLEFYTTSHCQPPRTR